MIQSTGLSFSAVVLVALASGFVFWHVNSERIHPTLQTPSADHHDAYMHGARYHRTDVNGNLHEQLQAKTAKHFPQENTLQLTQPELDLYGPHGESWHIRAAEGSSAQGSDTVVLRDNVRIEHTEREGSATVVVTTDKLIVHPNQGTADSDARVTITYPQIVLYGQGLHGDMKAGTLKLLTQIRGQYEPLTPTHQPTRSIAHSAQQPRTAL